MNLFVCFYFTSWGGHDRWLSPPSCHMTAHNGHVTAPGPTSDLAVELSEADMEVELVEEKSLTRERTPSVHKLPQAKGLEVCTDHTHTVGNKRVTTKHCLFCRVTSYSSSRKS